MPFDQHLPARVSADRPGRVVSIVHELPKRLRLRFRVLLRPQLDTDHLIRLIGELDGVRAVRANAAAATLVVEHDGRARTRQRILQRIRALGSAELRLTPPAAEPPPSLVPLLLRIALLAALPVLPGRLAQLLGWLAISSRILRGARSLLAHGMAVDVLDATAVTLSAVRGNRFTALTTDTLLTLGDYLEHSTERRSTDLLEHLLHPHPASVWVERDRALVQVPFEEVVSGDTVVVNAGELVPVDGVVSDGMAQVNQASVTGESVPVRKDAGDHVIAGSSLESGRLSIEAVRVGDQTTTARIAGFIRRSLAERSETERLAEEFANRRVLLTLGLAGGTLLLTRDISRVVSVLLIDYACAVKLTAPIAIKSTMAEAAHRGILIRGGPSIERLARVDTVVFDKTGTLTRGELALTDVMPLAPDVWPEDRLLTLAASIEEHTRHPIADAVVRAARRRRMPHIAHEQVDVVIAHGLTTLVGGERVLIGSRHYLQDHGGIDFAPYSAAAQALTEQGKLLLYAAGNGVPIGIIGLRDELRDDSAETIRRLRALGVDSVVMLTGDRKNRAEALAADVGIDQVFAELEPEQKAEIVRRLQREGRRVAFVGDGMNDAPALTIADVGIAMSRGAEIARATADIVLLDDHLSAVADAREAAIRAMGVIRSNFHAAIGINTALFLAASAGRLSPFAAALLHNGTTLALLGRALSVTGTSDPALRRAL